MSVESWYHTMNGRALGPVSAEGMQRLVHEKKLSAEDLIWKPGMDKWQKLAEVNPDWLKPQQQPNPEPMLKAMMETAPVPLMVDDENEEKPSVSSTKQAETKGKPTRQGNTKPTVGNVPLPTVANAAPAKSKSNLPVAPGKGTKPGASAISKTMPAKSNQTTAEEKEEKKGLFGRWFKR